MVLLFLRMARGNTGWEKEAFAKVNAATCQLFD